MKRRFFKIGALALLGAVVVLGTMATQKIAAAVGCVVPAFQSPAPPLGSQNVVIIGGSILDWTLNPQPWDNWYHAANLFGWSMGGLLCINPVKDDGVFSAFKFTPMLPADVNATNLDPFDTAVLNVTSFQMQGSTSTLTLSQKQALIDFVAAGKKLIIYDSESYVKYKTPVDYSWLPYPFTTYCPSLLGGPGGLLSIDENSSLASNDPTSPFFIDASILTGYTDAVSDMNVAVTLDSHWYVNMSGTNYGGVTGPVHIYARYGTSGSKGLIIYNGLDQDGANFEPYGMWLRKIWLQELRQPFNPDSLPDEVAVVGITLKPETAVLSVGDTHTLTVKVADLLGHPTPDILTTITILDGPNAGKLGFGQTDESGKFIWTYTGNGWGASNGVKQDQIEASFMDARGNVHKTTATADWVVVNSPPMAEAGGDQVLTVGELALFSGGGSRDPDGTIASYSWDFGDGTTGTGEAPTHAYAAKGDYTVTLTVTDDQGVTAQDSLIVHVVNAPPIVEAGGDKTLTVGEVAQFNGGGSSDPDGSIASYSWDFGDGTTGTGEAPTHAYAAKGDYLVTLTVTDNQGATATDILTARVVNSPPVAKAGGAYMVAEGATMFLNGVGSSDPENNIVKYEWDLDGDGLYDDAMGPTPSMTWPDNIVLAVALKVTDAYGAAGTDSALVTVFNAAPKIVSIAAPTEPLPTNTLVNVSGAFTDSGVLDTHTAMWAWGDGTSSSGVVNETNGSGSAAGSHSYTIPGIYTVTLTVKDKDGGIAQAASSLLVVYDPAGGFVTGGGWIESPAGAFVANPTLSGRANFGFVSKYQKGATVPTGQTEFQFKVANLSFHSDAYEWMVVTGARAQYKGIGKINGQGSYRFTITAIDGQVQGGGGSDKFRIRIWDEAGGGLIYDNEVGKDENDDPSTVIDGGNIVIHK